MSRFQLMLALMAACAIGVGIGAGLFARGPSRDALAAPPKCSTASLNGAYGIKFDGHSPLGRFVSVSRWSFDGKGKLRASESFVSEKNGPETRKIDGSYAVKRDCTFQVSFGSEIVRPHEAHGDCVLMAAGKQFFCLDVEKRWEITGVGVKI